LAVVEVVKVGQVVQETEDQVVQVAALQLMTEGQVVQQHNQVLEEIQVLTVSDMPEETAVVSQAPAAVGLELLVHLTPVVELVVLAEHTQFQVHL
tara:strand:- start:7 stop:291 length:285 start_codon:yes stop_codon:yes gene_type:complete